jgi:hypothetical protein
MKPSVFSLRLSRCVKYQRYAMSAIWILRHLAINSRPLEMAENQRRQQGFCCRWCAAELLHKLERAGAQRRAREEAAPRVDEFDIIDSSGTRTRGLDSLDSSRCCSGFRAGAELAQPLELGVLEGSTGQCPLFGSPRYSLRCAGVQEFHDSGNC